MDETTTTPSVDEGAQAQPDEQIKEVAEQPQEPTAEESKDLPKPSNDDNLEWLKNKGIDPTSTEAVSAIAEKWRTAEREMHAKTQQASELEKNIAQSAQQQINDAEASGQVDPAQIALARVAKLELQNSVNSFFMNNPEAKQHEKAMVDLVEQRPDLKQMVHSGYLGIQDLYAMTVGSNIDTVKAEGGQHALQQLANKQTASAVLGAATTSAVSSKKTDPILDLWAD